MPRTSSVAPSSLGFGFPCFSILVADFTIKTRVHLLVFTTSPSDRFSCCCWGSPTVVPLCLHCLCVCVRSPPAPGFLWLAPSESVPERFRSTLNGSDLYRGLAAACENPFQFWTVMDIFKAFSFVCLVSMCIVVVVVFLFASVRRAFVLLQLSSRTLPVDIRGFRRTKRAAVVTN